ncbi:MAG: 7-carboxy-7-deazaguanine synthase QueE [Bacteroidales bacterium]
MGRQQNNHNNLFAEGRKLPLMEEFYSIQGEGHHVGKPAYFIRLGGCDIGCSWCDTKVSWNAALHPAVKADTVVEHVLKAGARSVVVTGGEPLMYDLNYLCRKLKENGLTTYLETSGAHPLSGEWDWICVSPKPSRPPLDWAAERADELKVIIQSRADLSWAEASAKKMGENCMLYLQPEWSQYTRILPMIIDYVKRHQEWMISIQAHKFMHIP